MNVLFVAQCTKNALTETRRILDQFAERRGERTWQTPITQAGLDAVRKLLRQSARKNTAVACHWIRGRDHSELLWVVGDTRQFNDQGAVPTSTTARNVLRTEDENAWHLLPLMTALAALAACCTIWARPRRHSRIGCAIPACASATTTGTSGCRCGCSRPLWAATTMRSGCSGWWLAPSRMRMPRRLKQCGWTTEVGVCCAMGWMSLQPRGVPLLPR